MQKKAKEIVQGEIVKIGGEELFVESIEISDIGKQGSQKCRIVTKKKNGERVIIIRPSEYPLEIL